MEKILEKYAKKNPPAVQTGDTVRVHLLVREAGKERIQVFEGLVIAVKHGAGLDGTFTVRKESFGVGVERVFPLHSPRIAKVERVKQSKVRRSKLYYMRDLTGKMARLKDLNRDYHVWEEKDAEEELARIAEEKAKEAAEMEARKKAEEEEVERKARAAAGDRIKE
ncbi:MAG: 50S ribosomal protein L19 [bacterium ADurb.Bin400]|nr:MAG: 50S ribosomal protein L19 [bacterium ADurb.Bin400]